MNTEDKHFDLYLAGPWFTPEQKERLEDVHDRILISGLKVFSPKDENLFVLGASTPQKILQGNVNAIDSCKGIVVITDGKDVGTIWEAGYAYAKSKPILYVWLTHESHQKFNIMLAASGIAIHSLSDLDEQCEHFAVTSTFFDYEMSEEIYNYE